MRPLVLWLVSLLPAVAWASDGHGAPHGVPWTFIGFHILNLSILAALLYFLARRPVADALRNRSIEIRRGIEEARAARDDARRRLEDLEDKLRDFEIQVEDLRREMALQAEHERELILQRAEREAEAVRASAERAIREETLRARRQLQVETVTLAVRLAEQVLRERVGEGDHERLVRELVHAVRGSNDASPDDEAGNPGPGRAVHAI